MRARESLRRLGLAASRSEVRVVQRPYPRKVRMQGPHNAGRQHRHPVLRPLAVAHHDLRAIEVDIHHPEPEALAQPQAGAVQQARHDPALSCEARQQALGFRHRENARQTSGAPRALQPVQPGEGLLQDLPIEEHQRGERLVLSRGRHLPVARQVIQEGAHLGFAEIPGVAPAGKYNEPLHPVDVGLFDARAVVTPANRFAHYCEELGRRSAARRVQGISRAEGAMADP